MDENIQKKLHDLFILYSKNLPERIYEIEVQWHEQMKDLDFTKFQDFHRNVHSLCGSAGTYGYVELGKTARELEILLKRILEEQKLTEEDQEKITTFFNQIKSVLAHEAPKIPLLFATEQEPTDNKLVYILEEETELIKELSESLRQAGYIAKHIEDMMSLYIAIQDKSPIAVIINTSYLDPSSIDILSNLKKQQKNHIQMFCIIPNADLLPRLTAIRAGCVAFFQKPLDVSYLVQELNINCGLATNEAYRILILDDSKALAEYYSLILKQADMITLAITNPLELLKELEIFQPDLILMDIYMPECTGLELAALLRKERKYTKIPIIFLSTEDDKNKKLSAISIGGDDFLTKPISPQDLVSAVRSRSNRASILNYYMTTDSLTGLLNHSSILNQLNNEIIQARQKNHPLSFIMIDIDNFKLVNDTYGHPFGDLVIKKLASLMLLNLSNRDSVGRYGGEEFALILPEADLETSKKICNELRAQFSHWCFTMDNKNVSVTFSAGITCLNGKHDANKLVIEADQALYRAKQNGRNLIILFNEIKQ